MLLANLSDPIVWLRFARVLIFVVVAAGMLIEPMRCGGRNRSFHRILAFVFVALASHSYALAIARATVLANSPGALVGIDLLLAESLTTIAVVVVMARLIYDVSLWRTFHKHNERRKGTCWR